MRQRPLTDRQIAALKPRPKRYAEADPGLTGFYVRVAPTGAKSYAAVAYAPSGKQVWTTLRNGPDVLPAGDAREEAKTIIRRVREGLPAYEPPAHSFATIASEWVKRVAQPKGLRSLPEMQRVLDKHLLPAWRDRVFVEIRRSDITALLDKLEDKHGARLADYALTTFSIIASWHATRTDDYSSPVVRGMKRQKISEQARDRTLDDDEIRAVWAASLEAGTFGAIVRFALLTGQRRARIAEMKRSEVDEVGLWTMPLAPREKMNGGRLPLPQVAQEILAAQPRFEGNPYVFPAARKRKNPKTGEMEPAEFSGFGEGKKALDEALKATMPDMLGWTVHDLRRTARTLMSRAGVDSEIAERTLGHVKPGIAGTYDRFEYQREKGEALAKLAALIGTILNPPTSNVVPLRAGEQA